MELFSYFVRLLKTHPANLHHIDSLLTSGNDAEILQIAATNGKDDFSIYVKPCHVISAEASAVNKLTFQRGMLFYDGKPITDVLAIDVALK